MKKKISMVVLSIINFVLIFIPMFVVVDSVNPNAPTKTYHFSLFNISFRYFEFLSQGFDILLVPFIVGFILLYLIFALNVAFSLLSIKKDKFVLGVIITSVIEIISWIAFGIYMRSFLALIMIALTIASLSISLIVSRDKKIKTINI